MTTFDRIYQDCLRQILEHGIEELNQRTGHKTKTVPGMHFSVDGGFPLLSLRPIPARVFIAEQVWFLMGSRRPAEFLDKYTKIWREFTNLNGVVSTAYGYRWRHHFGRDQIGLLVKMLEKEPSSRHGVVMAWDPADDGLSPAPRKKNVPCPILFTVNLVGGKLHLHLMMRSNDMVVGCPFDVAGFALMQRILAARLGVGVGVYSHAISNAHIYDVHYDAAADLITRQGQAVEIELTAAPDWFTRAENADESLVDEIAALLAAQYTPGAPMGKLPVIL
jgi:thymidylate synthase